MTFTKFDAWVPASRKLISHLENYFTIIIIIIINFKWKIYWKIFPNLRLTSLWNCHWEEFLPFALKVFRVNCHFQMYATDYKQRELWTDVSRYLVNKVRKNVTEIAHECQLHHVIVMHQMPITSQWMATGQTDQPLLQPTTRRLGWFIPKWPLPKT